MNIELNCAYPLEELYANVRKTSEQCSNWLTQAEAHEGHAVIVGGGPSIEEKFPLIQWRHSVGQQIFALNGACRYLNEKGIVPDYQVFLDSNKEMSDRIGAAKQYLVASQCAPELLEALPVEKTILWHFALPELESHVPENGIQYCKVGGGTTVGLTSMCLSYAMGYRKLHIFGFDSSNRAGRDHAYDVPITEERLGNEILNSVKVIYGNRTFESTLTMTRQAEMFPIICNRLIDLGCIITIDVPRDTLLMAIVEEVQSAAQEAA